MKYILAEEGKGVNKEKLSIVIQDELDTIDIRILDSESRCLGNVVVDYKIIDKLIKMIGIKE